MLRPAEKAFADVLLDYFAGLRRRVTEALQGQEIAKAAGAKSDDHPYDYSTVQIVLADDVAGKITGWAEDNIADDDVYTDPTDPTLGRAAVLHVTVRYGLLTDDVDDVAALLQEAGIEPFEITLGKTSIFDADNYDVLKLEVFGNRLFLLNELLGEELTSMDSHADYRPHVTLAYIKKGRGARYANTADLDGVRVPVDRLQFVSSAGKESDMALEKQVAISGERT